MIPKQSFGFYFDSNASALSLALAAFVLLEGSPLLAQSLIVNPSFESNYNETFPHYGPINDWTGGSGVNESGGPFHNGGTQIPDQSRIAFIQGSGTLSQQIAGLAPGKQYWIQFFYDARNCCGGTIDLATRFNDVELDKIANVKPAMGMGATYFFRTVAFTPEADSGTLAFATIASGDATIDLDGITIVQRDTNNVPIMNPSFEASGLPAEPNGYVSPASISGWIGEGSYGVNVSGQGGFANNGLAPDQDNVAFVQDVSSLQQLVPNLVVGTDYQLSFAYNARSGNTPRLQVKAGDRVLFDEEVTAVGGTNPYRIRTVTFAATDTFVPVTFAQTKAGDQTILLDDIRLVGKAQEKLPPLEFTPTGVELGPGQISAINVTVPSKLLAIKAVDIKLRSPNPSVARLLEADADGIVTLHYDIGGTNVKSFRIEAVARGVLRIEIPESANLEIANDVGVNVVTSLVRNSSFESSPRPGGVGYGAVLAWNGGSGLNTKDGPFHDNGIVPDRDQVAFIQGAGTLSQEIAGLASGRNYWLQFRYNARNCCAGKVDLSVKFNGKELVKVTDVRPVVEAAQDAYHFGNVAFTPEGASGLLEFTTTTQGDATLLLDAISLIQRDPGEIVVENPSFEATGSPVGVGYIQPRKIAGWDITGGYGVNITGVGPFTDNGSAPDQDRALFLQGATTLSQLITGLTAGKDHTVIFYVNARNCCGIGITRYSVSFAEEMLLEEEILPVGGSELYHVRAVVIKPTADSGVLQFATTPEGDHTLLLDNIRVVPGVVKPSLPLSIAGVDATTLRISWPVGETFALQVTSALPGGWANVTEPVVIEGNLNTVLVTIGAGNRFYRLFSE